ncbi:MAG: RDD family protein [Gammaproteobacteria bacterium]|nr:RDD family protein [Gammaproteobacteria bacterium]
MTEHPPAGLLRRLAAAVYDALLVTALCMLTTLCLIAFRGGEPISPGNLLYQLSLIATAAVFFIGFWVHGGQTLGMRAWRLRVEQRSGEALDWKTGSIRFAAGMLSVIPVGLGLLWLLVDPKRLAWHDRISKTRVVLLPKPRKPKSSTK